MTAVAVLSLLAGACTAATGARPAAAATSHATLIAAGNAHSCMIQSGQAFCWGSNSNGQLGDGSTILGDAAYDNATATAGTVSYASPTLTWTGNLTPGQAATITYTVTINNPSTASTILTNTVTSAAPGSTCPPGTSSTPCAVSVDVIAGSLSITAPASASLGATAPSWSAANSLGNVQVTDNRGFGAGWTATVASTDFTTGGGSPAETIPASDGTYAISGLTTTGTGTFTHVTTVGLSGNPEAVVSATNVAGNTTVTWDPSVQVTVPGGAIAGTYTATVTHSVS